MNMNFQLLGARTLIGFQFVSQPSLVSVFLSEDRVGTGLQRSLVVKHGQSVFCRGTSFIQ